MSVLDLRGSPTTSAYQGRALRILVLTPDAFGGHGGIAQYARDYLTALCAHPCVTEVVACPRLMVDDPGALPPTLTFCTAAARGKAAFTCEVMRRVLSSPRFDLILCLHLNLLPLAQTVGTLLRAPVTLVVYGVEAWYPRSSRVARASLRSLTACVAISQLTLDRFLSWAPVPRAGTFVVPNAIHLDRYRPGPAPDYLVQRYGLTGRTVIMTLGRLDSRERAKGFDQVLDAMPHLLPHLPFLTYLIAGEGTDRERLEARARNLGLAGRVIFTGYVEEREKADHYRLADAYVMPSKGEGFGFVILEALACGIPVVGSTRDGTREALRSGRLGILVDPDSVHHVCDGIRAALRAPRRVPDGLDFFVYPAFEGRVHSVVDAVTGAAENSALHSLPRLGTRGRRSKGA